MVIAIAVVLVIAVIAVVAIVLQSRKQTTQSLGSTPPAAGPAVGTPAIQGAPGAVSRAAAAPSGVQRPHRPLSEPASLPTPARAVRPSGITRETRTPTAPPGQSSSNLPPLGGEVRGICCQVHGSMHGAMPPFGKLFATPAGLVFEATSRVISAAGGGLDDSDGATTMQSLGTMEMGTFRFEIPRDATQKVVFQGARATLSVDGTEYVLEGLGPAGKTLALWLQGNGFDR